MPIPSHWQQNLATNQWVYSPNSNQSLESKQTPSSWTVEPYPSSDGVFPMRGDVIAPGFGHGVATTSPINSSLSYAYGRYDAKQGHIPTYSDHSMSSWSQVGTGVLGHTLDEESNQTNEEFILLSKVLYPTADLRNKFAFISSSQIAQNDSIQMRENTLHTGISGYQKHILDPMDDFATHSAVVGTDEQEQPTALWPEVNQLDSQLSHPQPPTSSFSMSSPLHDNIPCRNRGHYDNIDFKSSVNDTEEKPSQPYVSSLAEALNESRHPTAGISTGEQEATTRPLTPTRMVDTGAALRRTAVLPNRPDRSLTSFPVHGEEETKQKLLSIIAKLRARRCSGTDPVEREYYSSATRHDGRNKEGKGDRKRKWTISELEEGPDFFNIGHVMPEASKKAKKSEEMARGGHSNLRAEFEQKQIVPIPDQDRTPDSCRLFNVISTPPAPARTAEGGFKLQI